MQLALLNTSVIIFTLLVAGQPIFISPMFVITVYLLKKYFPYADGSGLPQGYAVDIFDEYRLNKTYSLRSAIGKAILTL